MFCDETCAASNTSVLSSKHGKHRTRERTPFVSLLILKKQCLWILSPLFALISSLSLEFSSVHSLLLLLLLLLLFSRRLRRFDGGHAVKALSLNLYIYPCTSDEKREKENTRTYNRAIDFFVCMFCDCNCCCQQIPFCQQNFFFYSRRYFDSEIPLSLISLGH